MQLTRADDIHFLRHDGTVIVAPPITRDQMREVIVLDSEPGESVADACARRALQVEIFLRDAEWMRHDRKLNKLVPVGPISAVLGKLTTTEEIDIIHAFVAQHHGINPNDAVACQQAMREILKKKIGKAPMIPPMSWVNTTE